MVTAIRRVLDQELEANPEVLVFGEDVGPKGGVHAVTLGLQDKYGHDRVFDTSLNEEGIIGRAVGMALAGLMPVPEIQFRKYAEPATEQINDCGTMRWRTANRFAAPMVLRIPAASSSAATRGTARPTRCSSSIIPAGRWRCRRTPRMRSGCCARRCAATTRRSSSSIARCSTTRGRGGRGPAMTSSAVRQGEKRARATDHDRHLGRDGPPLRGGAEGVSADVSTSAR